VTLWAWLASVFGALGLGAGVWTLVRWLEARGARRAEIAARLEAARRLGTLRSEEDERKRRAAALAEETARTAAARTAEGPTPGNLAALHERTKKPWPPR
jgi:hypothetical protein